MHYLWLYINSVYLLVHMGDNSVIYGAYLRTKSQSPSADGSLIILTQKRRKEKKRKLEKLHHGRPQSCHFISRQKFTKFYNWQRSARASTRSGITVAYSLVRHIVISDCRKIHKNCTSNITLTKLSTKLRDVRSQKTSHPRSDHRKKFKTCDI